MFKNNQIVKKLSAGFMAGLCAFSMLGTSMGGAMRAKAEYIAGTENPAFPTVDEVIYQAATLLGSPYAFGCKGFTGIYYQDSYKPLDTDFVRNQGVDCSGLVYYTLTHLGFKTAGFSWNNPVPVDTAHWLSVNGDCTITYDGVTTKVDVEKMGLPTPADSSATKTYEYWECEDGSTITPGSVVVANKTGTDHAWIYMGEFDSRDEVVSYLKNIGVPDTLITAQTVGSGNGGGGKHWRIESNGSQGVVINNNVDGKSSSAFKCSAFRITQREVKFVIQKVLKKDNTVLINGKSSVDGTQAIYGVYMMRYLEYDFLRDHGLQHFDNWVSVFGEQKTDWELAPAGNKFKERTRIANYTGLPELMSMFKQIADIRTADTLQLDVPDCEYKVVQVEATPFQQELVQELADRADAINSGNVDPTIDNMLKITSDGRKLGLDPRLIDPSFEDNPDTKLNQCVENVARIHAETAEDKLTQIIFCDLGIPHKSSAETEVEGEDADDAKDKKSMAEQESLEEECDFCVYEQTLSNGYTLRASLKTPYTNSDKSGIIRLRNIHS